MKINITLDQSKNRKKGHPIVINIFVSASDRSYPSTNLFSKSEHWDFQKEEPKKNHPEYAIIIDKILDFRIKINKIKKSTKIRSSEQIKNFLFGSDDNIYDFWEQRILEEKKKLINQEIKTTGNAGVYETHLKIWKNYKPYLSYDEITYDFLTKFKIEKSISCTPSAINTYLKTIRAIYNQSVRRGMYNPEGNYPFEKIMEKQLPTKDKYLTISEMQTLYRNPINHDYYRYFFLAFYLGGLDFIDLATLKKTDIKFGRIKKMRAKGNTREVINNKVFPEAQKIIDHYHDENSVYVLPIHKYEYITYRQNYSKRIKALFSDKGVFSYVDSKTSRYSFIHIGSMELYQNRDIIKELVGHAQGDTLSIYEGKFPEKIKDEVHRKIIDAVVIIEKEFPSEAEYQDLA